VPDWLAPARVVDGVLLLVLVEAIGLALWHRLTGRGPRPAQVAANLGAGAALLLALRAALVDAHWSVPAAWLLAALVVHVLDLGLRWRT
jgi:hypothetical protein